MIKNEYLTSSLYGYNVYQLTNIWFPCLCPFFCPGPHPNPEIKRMATTSSLTTTATTKTTKVEEIAMLPGVTRVAGIVTASKVETTTTAKAVIPVPPAVTTAAVITVLARHPVLPEPSILLTCSVMFIWPPTPALGRRANPLRWGAEGVDPFLLLPFTAPPNKTPPLLGRTCLQTQAHRTEPWSWDLMGRAPSQTATVKVPAPPRWAPGFSVERPAPLPVFPTGSLALTGYFASHADLMVPRALPTATEPWFSKKDFSRHTTRLFLRKLFI